MRRDARAANSGSIKRRAVGLCRLPADLAAVVADPIGGSAPAGRRLALVVSVLGAALALLALSAAPASATRSHFYLEDFGSAAQPSFSAEGPTSLAVDQSSGDVLVLDPEAATISRYKADGTPSDFSALGTNVIDGQGLVDGTPEGGLAMSSSVSRQQIAVDNSGTATDGNIYVTQDVNRRSVYVFASSGAYLGKLSEYRQGADATGPSTAFGSTACGVAVAPSGAVYVSDAGGYIHKYVPSGNPPVDADNVANLSYPEPCALAVGVGPTAGFLFVTNDSQFPSTLSKLDAATGEVEYVVDERVLSVYVDPANGDVYAAVDCCNGGTHAFGGFTHFDASGASGATLLAYVPGLIQGRGSKGIAVRGSNGRIFLSDERYEKLRVFGPLLTQADLEIRPARELSATRARLRGVVNPDGAAVTECKFEYGTVESGTFSESLPCEELVPTDTSKHAVSALVSNLPADGAEYNYRLVVTNTDDRIATSGVKTFDLPLPVFTGGPTSVLPHSAVVNGTVRPEGEQVTECTFEYGLTTAYGASAPCSPPPESIPADFEAHLISATLEGLDEFTLYHYRLSFATAGATRTGRDELFRTVGSSGLPDNRRYEQVSPADKNDSDIDPGKSMAALDGNRLTIISRGSFAGAPASQQVSGLQYLATRGSGGWSTESIAPPGGEFGYYGGNEYQVFSSDLSKGAFLFTEENPQLGTLDPSAVPGYNLYLYEAGSGSFRLLNGTLDDAGNQISRGSVVWGSRDFTHLAIVSHNPLTSDAPSAAGQCDGRTVADSFASCAYEWDNGTLRLASVLPGGEAVAGEPGAAPGESCSTAHAMSDDGSRLFFTSPPLASQGSAQIYARENGTSTTPISESERTAPGGPEGQDVHFQNVEAAHGDRVLFTTANSLLDADTDETNDLYLYDYTKPAGERLTLISADGNPNAPAGAAVHGDNPFGQPPCGGVAGASEDLRRVYFVADNQIVAGEPEAAGPKLYLWDDTGASPKVSYLGSLDSFDYLVWQGALTGPTGSKRARLSADGRYLAFLSRAQLTDFENEGQEEVYRYDAESGSLECASCSADAVPAAGEIGFEERASPTFGGESLINHLTTNVTEAGQVFFHTRRGLIPADSNGKMDVYEYEGGQLHLISAGDGPEDSLFLDATPSGTDVFFTTKDRLVGWDKDDNADAYDARVGGGFPEPPPAPPACEGDACQPPPVVPNDATPASGGFKGSGNLSPKPRRCAKGKVRSQGRCRKRKRQHRKHAHPRRTATRSHG